jgi:hypothetical protein
VRQAILAAADADFIAGIRTALAVATVFLVAVFVLGYVRFPRGMGGIADARSEAAKIEAEEAARGG